MPPIHAGGGRPVGEDTEVLLHRRRPPNSLEKPVVYPWVYPQTRGTRAYPYPHGRVWVFTGVGMGMDSDTRVYTRAIH